MRPRLPGKPEAWRSPGADSMGCAGAGRVCDVRLRGPARDSGSCSRRRFSRVTRQTRLLCPSARRPCCGLACSLSALSAGQRPGAEALGKSAPRRRAGGQWERRRSLYGGGSVGPGFSAVALCRRPLLWGLLQGADPHAAHLLRPGLAAAHQLPLPLHRGFHDAQRAPAGSY